MSSDKTATERLRELLDERGVHYVGNGDTVRWLGKDGCVCRAYTRAYSRRADLCVDVAITYVPPERAVEATLGNDGAAELRAENAKLRELVRDMWRCYVRGHDWGPYGAPEKQWVEEQMQELGIEEDE